MTSKEESIKTEFLKDREIRSRVITAGALLILQALLHLDSHSVASACLTGFTGGQLLGAVWRYEYLKEQSQKEHRELEESSSGEE